MKSAKQFSLSVASGLLAVTLSGLGSNVFADDGWTDLTKTTGSGLFQEKCGMCHRAGGMGTGILSRRMSGELALLENRKDLQAPFIANVVRNGLGVMFPISRGEVSDGQLETIIDYLKAED